MNVLIIFKVGSQQLILFNFDFEFNFGDRSTSDFQLTVILEQIRLFSTFEFEFYFNFKTLDETVNADQLIF
jgi:hypothetical protein